jgi:D-alanine transaminase
MTTAPTVAWLGGRLVPFDQAVVPIEDRGLQFGESLYEVLPVTAGRVRTLPEHAARMIAGAAQLGLPSAPDLGEWERVAAALLAADQLREALLYAQLTGGAAPRLHAPAQRPVPTFLAYLRAHRYPGDAEVARGIRAITVEDPRWARCDLKTTMLLPAVLAKYEAAARGADEAIFTVGDLVREGSSSNVFVIEHGRVVGVPQSSEILPGVTRALMERACAALGTALSAEPISVPRLRAADEVFITSTSRLAMPVVAVDGHAVGDGSGGPVCRAIAVQMRRDLELA